MKAVTILGIESSCDDTAAAVMRDGHLLSNVVSSQLDHELYGGVVPEVASRAHVENIIPVVREALGQANVTRCDLDAVACTQGPGLLGSLIVGYTFARSLAQSLQIPLIGINHMQAHVLAHFIEEPRPRFPFLCLTVSGGHTQLVIIEDYLKMRIIGSTLDDAAGEAFDKAGKMLGLPYPSGPQIDRLARMGSPVFEFPEPQVPDLMFSFSGLKTSILYFLQKEIENDPTFIQNNLNDLCASIQKRIVTILMNKLSLAVERTGITEVAIAGGVSANSGLRKALENEAAQSQWNIYIPKLSYCTDNAAMVAINGHYKFLKKDYAAIDSTPNARLNWS